MTLFEAISFKERLVLGHIKRTVPVRTLCKLFKVSLKTVLKWVKRYKKHGMEGLKELSRAPRRSPNRKPRWIEGLVCMLYRCGIEVENIFMEIRKLCSICEKTIYNILHRHNEFGRAVYKPSFRRFQYKNPNDLWHIDITKFSVKGEGKLYIIAIIDNCSRKIMNVGVYRRQTAKNVVEVFRKGVDIHGTPKAVLSDNGKQFTSKLFGAFCSSHLIKHRRTRPYNPKCNGKIERWFKTIKKHLRKDWYLCMEELEQAVLGFVEMYNNRPKRVLEWKTPNEVHC